MSFPVALLNMMDATIKVSTRTTHNNYGEPSFASSTATYSARVVEKPGYLRTGDQEAVAYSHTAWVASTGTVSITVSDRLTYNGTVFQVMGVERYPDEDGPHHVKVLFGY